MNRLLFLSLLFLPWSIRAQAPLATAAPSADSLQLTTLPVALTEAAVADTVPAPLRGLSAEERRQLGRTEAKMYYRPRKGIFWTSAGLGFVSIPLLVVAPARANSPVVGALIPAAPVAGAVVLGAVPPRKEHVEASAPHPQLLRDPDYRHGYVTRANSKKLTRSLLGWGSGAAVSLGLAVGTLMILFPNGWSSGE